MVPHDVKDCKHAKREKGLRAEYPFLSGSSYKVNKLIQKYKSILI